MPQRENSPDSMGGHYQAFVERFMALDKQLDGLEHTVTQLETTQGTLVEGVSNFREFQTTVREFITDYRAREDERKKMLDLQQKAVTEHLDYAESTSSNRNRQIMTFLTIIGTVVALVGVLVGILVYLHTLEDTNKGLIKIPVIHASESGEQVYSRNQRQDALDRSIPQ